VEVLLKRSPAGMTGCQDEDVDAVAYATI